MKKRLFVLILSLAVAGSSFSMSLDLPIERAGETTVDVAKAAVAKGAEGTDATDIWWNPAESGWGMQVIQNNDTLFATIYLYNAAGQPTFFVGVLNWNGSAFSGQLFSSTGTYYGAPWNPATVSEALVGSITITPVYVNQINLVYTVGGNTVNKPGLSRLPLKNDNMTGTYSGVANQTQACTSTLPSGTYNNRGTAFSIAHGQSITATIVTATSTCNYTGNYTQQGRFGKSVGTFFCNNGETGTLNFFEMQVYASGIISRYSISSNYCQVTGQLTATRQP